ncbi:MAG TPA: energy transducer TonB [Beijerinckiaceae bacterium]|jgi:protein TonB|nr:energy transducer TonB [Beijerinckiaceae bacterium]
MALPLLRRESASDGTGVTLDITPNALRDDTHRAPLIRNDFVQRDIATALGAMTSLPHPLPLPGAVDRFPVVKETGARRLFAAGAAALAAHGIALFLLAKGPNAASADAGSEIVVVELAPMPVALPAPHQDADAAPGPPAPQSESAPDVAQDAPTPERKDRSSSQVDDLPLAVAEDAEPQAPPDKTVAPATPPASPPSESSAATAPPPAPTHADAIAGPPLGSVDAKTPAEAARWEQSLVARIERSKRYPIEARDRFGTVRVAFAIDRNGRLITSRIVASSGSAILDDEALATIQRAVPFPPPPADIAESKLSFILPIRFLRRAQSHSG